MVLFKRTAPEQIGAHPDTPNGHRTNGHEAGQNGSSNGKNGRGSVLDMPPLSALPNPNNSNGHSNSNGHRPEPAPETLEETTSQPAQVGNQKRRRSPFAWFRDTYAAHQETMRDLQARYNRKFLDDRSFEREVDPVAVRVNAYKELFRGEEQNPLNNVPLIVATTDRLNFLIEQRFAGKGLDLDELRELAIKINKTADEQSKSGKSAGRLGRWIFQKNVDGVRDALLEVGQRQAIIELLAESEGTASQEAPVRFTKGVSNIVTEDSQRNLHVGSIKDAYILDHISHPAARDIRYKLSGHIEGKSDPESKTLESSAGPFAMLLFVTKAMETRTQAQYMALWRPVVFADHVETVLRAKNRPGGLNPLAVGR